jgi:adenosine kinase
MLSRKLTAGIVITITLIGSIIYFFNRKLTVAPKSVLFFGNPILDIMKDTGVEYILQHDLTPDSEVFEATESLFSDKVRSIFSEFASDSSVETVAGGASQNAARVASYISRVFGEFMKITYTGAVAKDEIAQCMLNSCVESGIDALYQEVDAEGCSSGKCAAMFFTEAQETLDRLGQTCKPSGRTLATCLEAARKFDDSKFEDSTMEKYDMFYTEGFFVPTSFKTLMRVAKHAQATGKPFIVNLSSVFILTTFYKQFMELLPYATVVFGNETEFAALWNLVAQNGAETPEGGFTYETFAKFLGNLTAEGVNQRRTVVITRGTDPAVVFDAATSQVSEFPIFPLKDGKMFKDTNAAGDSYVGGFISAFAMGLPLNAIMQRAALGAGIIVQMRGCSFPKSEEEFNAIVQNLKAPQALLAKVSYPAPIVAAPAASAA